MLEHRFTLEHRPRRKHLPWGPDELYVQTRWHCACGATGSWRKHDHQRQAEQANHALDGQLSFIVAP